jgi:hypothetical protein
MYAGSCDGRVIAKLRIGDGSSCRTDIVSANAVQPDIAEEYQRYGLGQ